MRTKKIILLLLVLVFLSFTTGCLGNLFNQDPVISSTPGTIAKVGILYTYQIVATDPNEADILTYTLSVKPTGMTVNETTGAVSWTPLEDQETESYLVTIEVSDGKNSVFQTFTVTVAEAELSSIEVVPSEMRVPMGSSETIDSITAHYENETTAVIELDSDDVSYSSDDEDIATVSELGVVTGVSEGTAIITVTYTEEEITKTAVIDVTVPSALTAILVQPEFMVLYEGNSQSITSIIASYDGAAPNALIELSSAIYSSLPAGIVTINNSGIVTGVSEGATIITVSYTEGLITKTDTIYVEVQEVPVILTSLTVLPVTMEITVGGTKNITTIIAGYNDATTVNIPLDSADVIYTSSLIGIATVDTTGVVTAVAAGSAIITVSYTEGLITKTDTVAVTVI